MESIGRLRDEIANAVALVGLVAACGGRASVAIALICALGCGARSEGANVGNESGGLERIADGATMFGGGSGTAGSMASAGDTSLAADASAGAGADVGPFEASTPPSVRSDADSDVPFAHRPAATACGVSPGGGGAISASSLACASDNDCRDAGTRFWWCTGGACYGDSLDECLTDTDCPTGQACACRPNYGGWNSCAPSNCRVDSDCGPMGFCSPSYSAYCSAAVEGYFCRTVADTCETDSDCKDAGGSLPSGTSPQCAYQPNLGYWTCRTSTACPSG